MRHTAHQSDDDTMPMHCPWCGSGNILGRSDGTIACDFCGRAFTVALQPMYPAMPQQPDQMNAGAVPEPTEGGPVDPTADAGMGIPPAPGPADVPGPAGAPVPAGPPSSDQQYMTSAGHLLSEQDYIDHLALQHTPDRALLAQKLKDHRG